MGQTVRWLKWVKLPLGTMGGLETEPAMIAIVVADREISRNFPTRVIRKMLISAAAALSTHTPRP